MLSKYGEGKDCSHDPHKNFCYGVETFKNNAFQQQDGL